MISSSIDSRKRAGHSLSTTDSQQLEDMTLNSCFAQRFVCSLSIAIFVVIVYTADDTTWFLPLRRVFWANLTWGLYRYDTRTGTTTATLSIRALCVLPHHLDSTCSTRCALVKNKNRSLLRPRGFNADDVMS